MTNSAIRKANGKLGLCLLIAVVFLAQPDQNFASAKAAETATEAAGEARDGQHDFDFEFGEWNARIKRLVDPLTGSSTWVEYEGSSVVRRIWDGRGNLGELNVSGDSSEIQGLSLRLYNPETREWSIRWANARDGMLGPPMIGGFDANGRGEFYNQETYNGRAIFVRFIFSDIEEDSFRLEQAFSADGGKNWEPNWIATFSR